MTPGAGPAESCDLVVYGAYLVTVDSERRIFADGAIAVAGRRIVAIGPTKDVRARWQGSREIDVEGALIHPGFIECHMHVSIHAGRNAITEPVTWESQQSFYSGLWNAIDDEDEYVGSRLACLELALHGATAFMECGTVHQPDAVAKAAEEVGIRAVLGDPFIWDEGGFGGRGDKSPPVFRAPSTEKRAFAVLGGQLFRNADPTALVQGHVAIIGMATCSEALTLHAKALARQHGVILNQHQSYGQDDAADDAARFGKPAMVRFKELNVLDEQTSFAHMNVLGDAEVAAMTDTGMSIVWCPLASMMYGVGATTSGKHFQLSRCGCNIALGSDSPNYTGRFDTGAQAFAAVLMSREQARSADALKAEDGLVMATINGARAIGMADRIGSLETGKLADFVVRRRDIVEAVPRTNRIQNLIYSSRSKGIDTVVVNGRIIVENGKSTTIDLEHVLLSAQRSSDRLLARMGFSVQNTWPVIHS
jgi:5-methylthioadenosine/S-adenosylhomocysteine deaminase